VAYQAVQGHLETWLHLARSSEPDGVAVPAHVEREFRQYLTGGIPAPGYARACCAGCGGCSACGNRRMVETAARLVDQVFPEYRCGSGCSRSRSGCGTSSIVTPTGFNPVPRIFLAEGGGTALV
jgi:hypothetical protein